MRAKDSIKQKNAFFQHLEKQHHKYFFSGMHQPFITTPEQRSFFEKHFSQYLHLLPISLTSFQEQQCLKTPVQIRRLSDCPISLELENAKPLAIGGPPALMWATFLAKNKQPITYLNDERRMPIAFGSAWHLEQDAESEAPTAYKPTTFLWNQIIRACIGHSYYSAIKRTGLSPWRSLDWIGWLRHPKAWLTGFRVALRFQLATMQNLSHRQKIIDSVAQQCRENEKFFEELNKEMGRELLMPGHGSIIVARNMDEVTDLHTMQNNLKKERRTLVFLSTQEMLQRYGYTPNGLLFAEKTHDRILSPNFMKLSKAYIERNSGTVINGTLVSIYVDGQNNSGIAEYYLADGQKKFLTFSSATLSLGNQMITDINNKSLFDIVSARGVSALAYVYLPKGYQLPPAIVCGGTNHVTKLSKNPVPISDNDGKSYDLYLVRMTAGACITPTVSEKDAANYDGTTALGLITAVCKTLGDQCKVEPISVYGCNRQMNQYGQTRWINPYPGVSIQYGAGGGGLTRSPDFATQSKF